ncbi:hypothetical protein R4K54_12050 [Brachyspira murdochii]|uniref:Uncharacterized protein n=2 Tax=Brachyspira murdochii TaxID=84378 RepID=D5UA34_BRAM5|nr:hypothetical protein [Brachyspira murdochii]ADG71557.1 hypothetical protein Bmur_1470 [Brachyspira murdochii DSM 12563]
MYGDGSPFGNLVSNKKIDLDKIENIEYKLKIKYYLIAIVLIILLIIDLIYIFSKQYYKLLNIELSKPLKLEYIIYSIIVFLCYVMYIYSDVLIHVPFSVNLWNVHPFNFNYEVYMKVGSYHYSHWPYLAYIIYSILFFPIWVYTKLKGFTFYTWHHEAFSIDIFELMYIKTILFIFVLVSARTVYKISKEFKLSDNNSKLSEYLFLSSPFTILPALFISQMDIITIYFMLLGILSYIKHDKKYLMWFALSICLKNYPIFILFPLILLREKKLKEIILYNIIAIAPFIITNSITKVADLLYYHNPPLPYIPAKDIYGEVFSLLLLNKIANLPVFLILYSIICIYCFFTPKKDDDKILSINIIFVTFVSFLFGHSEIVPLYRLVVLSPFIPLLLFTTNLKYLKFNIFIEFISLTFYSIYLLIRHTYVSLSEATRTYSIPLIKFFYKEKSFKYNNIRDLIPILSTEYINNFIYSFMFIGLLILAYLFSYYSYKNNFQSYYSEEIQIKRYLILIRYIPVLVVMIGFIILLFVNKSF